MERLWLQFFGACSIPAAKRSGVAQILLIIGGCDLGPAARETL